MRKAAVEMRLAGKARREIAAALGFKTGGRTLDKWLKDVPAPDWTKRPNAKDDVREKAVAMRKEGRSYREIGEVVSVAKSTLSLWLRDVPLTDEQRTALQVRRVRGAERRAAAIKAQHTAFRERITREAASQIADLAESELFVAGVVAYWAEGTKDKPWRNSQQVKFVTSDPRMIRFFLAWVRLVGIGVESCMFQLSIHESGNEPRALEYWSDVVGAPLDQFQKTNFKRHNPKTVRKNTGSDYYGCLCVTVRRSSVLYRRIAGWFDGIVAQLASTA